ncbi:MAG: hypothetical protein F7B61_02525 [Caldisphaeraceae archaeon]|nr:hypothetical protein [Caldisphaeraceae archaeon]
MSVSKICLNRVSPFSDLLVKSFLFLGQQGIDYVEERRNTFAIYGKNLEVALKEAFLLAADLMGDYKRLPLTGNDRREKDFKEMLKAIGATSIQSDDGVLEFAGINISNLINNNEKGIRGPLIALIKSEYYEESRTPMFSSDYEKVLNPSQLYVLMALGGYVTFRLGRSKYVRKNPSVVVTIEDPFTKDKEIINALFDFKTEDKSKRKYLPRAITSKWAFSLWLALNFNISHVVKVNLVDEGNRINVKESFITDLKRLRSGINRTLGALDEKKARPINSLLLNVLNQNAMSEEIQFTKLLYETINGINLKYDTIILGSRGYSLLLSDLINSAQKKASNEFKRYENMWKITKLMLKI